MQFEFAGAAREVTGSCHILRINGKTVLLDCGMFQGRRAETRAKNATLPIDEGICLTATLDILKAIARGEGPQSAILALGYAGWAPGQLENEIQHNGWLHCSADAELIFGQDTGGKYDKALKKIGIDLGMLSSEAGHA